MTFRATFTKGRVELEGDVRLREGTPLRVEPARRPRKGTAKPKSAAKPKKSPRKSRKPKKSDLPKLIDNLLKLAGRDGGPPDMALEHDHYIYGTPKRYSSGSSPSSRSARTPKRRR